MRNDIVVIEHDKIRPGFPNTPVVTEHATTIEQ